MAMIKCPECGKEISDRASACPNCAFPIAEAKNDGLIRIKMGTIKSGTSGKQKVTVTANNEVIWEGTIGSIAEFRVEGSITVEIKYHLSAMHYGGSCEGKIEPDKGNKYSVSARQGIMKTVLSFQRVDILDAD